MVDGGGGGGGGCMIRRVVLGGDFGGGDRGGDAGGAGRGGGGSDEGDVGVEDAIEVGVNGRLDIDEIKGGVEVDEGDEDAQPDAEHDRSSLVKLGGGFAGFVKGLLTLLSEGDDFDEKNDVLAVQLHAEDVNLQPVVVAGEIRI